MKQPRQATEMELNFIKENIDKMKIKATNYENSK